MTPGPVMIDGPGECRGRSVGVAGGVGGGDGEGVAARGETAVGSRAGAWCGSHAVEAALEGRAGFCRMECEGGRGAAGRACRAAVDDRVGSRRVDGPGVTGRQAGVARRVGGYDCEGVAAFGKRSGVALRARAGDIAARVQTALEADSTLGVGEAEGGRGLVGRVGRITRDRRSRWRHRVHHPGEAGWRSVGVARCVGGLDGEGVAAIGQAVVGGRTVQEAKLPVSS